MSLGPRCATPGLAVGRRVKPLADDVAGLENEPASIRPAMPRDEPKNRHPMRSMIGEWPEISPAISPGATCGKALLGRYVHLS